MKRTEVEFKVFDSTLKLNIGNSNLLIVGEKGSGKTTLLNTLINVLCTTYSYEDIQLLLFDSCLESCGYYTTSVLKNSGKRPLVINPYFSGVYAAKTPFAFHYFLGEVGKEISKRTSLLNENQDVQLNPFIVFMDLSDTVFQGGLRDNLISELFAMITMGNLLSVFFIVATGSVTQLDPFSLSRFRQAFISRGYLEQANDMLPKELKLQNPDMLNANTCKPYQWMHVCEGELCSTQELTQHQPIHIDFKQLLGEQEFNLLKYETPCIIYED